MVVLSNLSLFLQMPQFHVLFLSLSVSLFHTYGKNILLTSYDYIRDFLAQTDVEINLYSSTSNAGRDYACEGEVLTVLCTVSGSYLEWTTSENQGGLIFHKGDQVNSCVDGSCTCADTTVIQNGFQRAVLLENRRVNSSISTFVSAFFVLFNSSLLRVQPYVIMCSTDSIWHVNTQKTITVNSAGK